MQHTLSSAHIASKNSPVLKTKTLAKKTPTKKPPTNPFGRSGFRFFQKSRIRLAIACIVSTFAIMANASELDRSIDDMSLDELMNVKVTVASNKAATIGSSAGIVTLITSDEIAKLGARDLIDVLNQVPGLFFNSDTQGAVGMGLRGSWGHEGKILLVIDDMEFNENMYGTLQFGRHYPVHQIDRIEIIRGPGSVTYGGSAELGVIKITTKANSSTKTGNVSTMAGIQSSGTTESTIDIGLNHPWDHGGIGFVGTFNQGQRSDKDIRDVNGDTYAMKGKSGLKNTFVTSQARWGGFRAQAFYDNYVITDQSAFGDNLSMPVAMSFNTIAGRLSYSYELSQTSKLAASLSMKRDQPWMVTDPIGQEMTGEQYNRVVDRTKADLQWIADLTPDLNLLAGVETFNDASKILLENSTFTLGGTEAQFYDQSIFTQAVYQTGFGDFTVGGRYENHSGFGKKAVPRLAFVREGERWGIKALLSQAFRSPSIEQFKGGPASGILPETTTVIESEISHKLTDQNLVAFNIFSIQIDDPIVYNYVGGDSYKNFSRTGTYGLEATWKQISDSLIWSASYSYYRPNGNEVSYYEVPGHKELLLGAASHKVTAQGTWKISSGRQITPSLVFTGTRYGYSYSDSAGMMALTEFPAIYQMNLIYQEKDFMKNDLSLNVGLFNLFNSDFRYIQPYNGGDQPTSGGHAPVPSEGTQLTVRIEYPISL